MTYDELLEALADKMEKNIVSSEDVHKLIESIGGKYGKQIR